MKKYVLFPYKQFKEQSNGEKGIALEGSQGFQIHSPHHSSQSEGLQDTSEKAISRSISTNITAFKSKKKSARNLELKKINIKPAQDHEQGKFWLRV